MILYDELWGQTRKVKYEVHVAKNREYEEGCYGK